MISTDYCEQRALTFNDPQKNKCPFTKSWFLMLLTSGIILFTRCCKIWIIQVVILIKFTEIYRKRYYKMYYSKWFICMNCMKRSYCSFPIDFAIRCVVYYRTPCLSVYLSVCMSVRPSVWLSVSRSPSLPGVIPYKADKNEALCVDVGYKKCVAQKCSYIQVG